MSKKEWWDFEMTKPVEIPSWFPITTAPKDGTDIIVFSGAVRIAYWVHGQWTDYAHSTLCPTHWMPLPPPPQKEGT